MCYVLSCVWLCNPMDYSLPCFSVHGIFQARVLECVAIFYSRGSSQPRGQTHISVCLILADGSFTTEPRGKGGPELRCNWQNKASSVMTRVCRQQERQWAAPRTGVPTGFQVQLKPPAGSQQESVADFTPLEVSLWALWAKRSAGTGRQVGHQDVVITARCCRIPAQALHEDLLVGNVCAADLETRLHGDVGGGGGLGSGVEAALPVGWGPARQLSSFIHTLVWVMDSCVNVHVHLLLRACVCRQPGRCNGYLYPTLVLSTLPLGGAVGTAGFIPRGVGPWKVQLLYTQQSQWCWATCPGWMIVFLWKLNPKWQGRIWKKKKTPSD